MTRILKLLILELILLAAIAYAIAVLNKPALYVFYVFTAYWVLVLTFILLSLYLFKSVWKESKDRSLRRSNKYIMGQAFFACIIFFGLCGWFINHYMLPGFFNPVSIASNTVLLCCTVFWGWGLISHKRSALLAAAVSFPLVIAVLFVANAYLSNQIIVSATDQVRSLQYVSWMWMHDDDSDTSHKSGVVTYDTASACDGINIFASHGYTACLIDMNGTILHTWNIGKDKDDEITAMPRHVKLCSNCNLLVIDRDGDLTNVDWNSHIKWRLKINAHHDISIADNGDIYTLGERSDVIFYHGLPLPVINDYVMIISPDGKIKKGISLAPCLKSEIAVAGAVNIYYNLIKPQTLKRIIEDDYHLFGDSFFDVFHNNGVSLIDRDIDQLCTRGCVLLSPRELDLIAIFDPGKGIVWSWGRGHIHRQHHPTLLDNGNILIFDNGRDEKKPVQQQASRIIELDPRTKKIAWEFRANPPGEFFSPFGGGCQRLPNGNTLITEMNRCRVFEVTPGGRIVWEYYSTELQREKNLRAAIYRMERITDPRQYPSLAALIRH